MISAKVIMPILPLLNVPKIIAAVENALDGAALGVQADFLVTVDTWNDKPEFKIDKEDGKRTVYTTSSIYHYVNAGTAVRRALMSPDFKPKTRSGFIGSNMGKGGVVLISKKLNLPGIKAREFDKVIEEKWQKQLPEILQRAVDAAVAR